LGTLDMFAHFTNDEANLSSLTSTFHQMAMATAIF
jgi:hypothetical protein